MNESELAKYRGKLFQLYSLSAVNVEERFQKRFGYPPQVIIVTGGGVLAGPVQEKDNGNPERDDRPTRA